MPKGFIALVLHAHLPFIRHPEHEFFMEEDWLFEAITETYIPLLSGFESLRSSNRDFRITMSLTPPLICMLDDQLLRERYVRHLTKLIELSKKEVIRTRFLGKLNDNARKYVNLFESCLQFYEKHSRDIVGVFKSFQDSGNLEIITCGATHGFLPFMDTLKPAQRAQISIAADHYRKRFKRDARGIWLPECAYVKGLDKYLAQENIKFFFTDGHGVLCAKPRPTYGVYAPIITENRVAVFGRDLESSQQVWSSEVGYPGHSSYREFYRDIGFDLDFDYIRPYIHPDGIRMNTGIKYYRITGKCSLQQKEPYCFETARYQAYADAADFVDKRRTQINKWSSRMRIPPIVVSPYDAELFGHWWYEGPHFIIEILRKICDEGGDVQLTTPAQHLENYGPFQPAAPSNSTWGAKGYNEVWLEGSNEWIYRHLYECARRMIELAALNPDTSGKLEKTLNQMARELLLAQSSDWAFIMKTNTTVEYANKRTRIHIDRFNTLYKMVIDHNLDMDYVDQVYYRDNIFSDIDYRVYIPKPEESVHSGL